MKRFIPAAALAAMCFAVPAWAQINNPGMLPNPGGVGPSRAPDKGRTATPPSAVPGARAEAPAVAPAERTAADLPPNEALFDAINRGDLATAKDAINRGADLSGTNVLGLTPIELAVDLGRNDISFLLLSLRGGAGYTTSRGPVTAQTPAQERARSRAERLAAERAERNERLARNHVVATRVGPAPVQVPRLFAGNGGGPIPQAGFLGFDAGH